MNSSNDFRSRLIIRIYKFGVMAQKKKVFKAIYKIADKLVIQLMFGAEFPAKAKIGRNIVLPHGAQGTIISPDAIIGDNVVIYHQVTIGGFGLGQYGEECINNNKEKVGAPTIGNNVFIGAGAKILGPVNIGDGAKIGANAVVVRDVPANSTAVGIPAKIKFSNP